MKHLSNDELIKIQGGCIRITKLYKFVKVVIKSFFRNLKFLSN